MNEPAPDDPPIERDGAASGVRITLLGSVSLTVDGVAVPLGGPKQRAVVSLLALDVGRVVPLDRLIQELWRDDPPAQAMMALQSYISRLRRVLAGVAAPGAASWIATKPPGWVLNVRPDSVDAVEFAALLTDGRSLLASGQPGRAAENLRQALALWTGAAMGDLGMAEFAMAERTRLEQLRLDATETLFEADLATGETATVVEAAERFIQDNPFRERGWISLMLGLYRTGRQADALAAAERLRVILADELGLDPSAEIRDLTARILRQDPGLAGPAPHRRPVKTADAEPLKGANAERRPAALADEQSPAGLIVGRDDVLAIADEVLAQAFRGRGRAVLIEGPAGIGKSTVLRAISDRATPGAVLRCGPQVWQAGPARPRSGRGCRSSVRSTGNSQALSDPPPPRRWP